MHLLYNSGYNNHIIINNTKDYFLREKIIDTIQDIENNSKTYYLNNNDFTNGSFRIKEPGIYKLTENIVFSPNENNGFFPTEQQFINNDYPRKEFHLGFFAAIVIESNNVIIDLNDHSIEMSSKFKIIQRFFNLIELSHAPFIPKQGPGDFTSKISRKYNICIKNGILKLSSHNGIHGNNGEMILLKNLNINSFEVSGIQLNGYKDVLIENCIIHNTSIDVPISAFFSNSIFARLLSKNISLTQSERLELSNNIDEVLDCIEKNIPIPEHCKYLSNELNIPDCNVTGIVLSTRGVAINDFKKDRNGANDMNNTNIIIKDVLIKNLLSNPIEILGISRIKNYDINSTSYTDKVQVGPAGDVIPIMDLLKDNKFNGTALSALQLKLAKNNVGTSNVSNELHDFVNGDINLEDFITLDKNETNDNLEKYHLRGNLDIMSHTMKGNMGVFINAGKDIYLDNINIDGVYNNGERNSDIKNTIYEDEFRGNISTGITESGSSNIYYNNINIKNIVSKTGKTIIYRKI